jgi:phosphoglycerate dehydrogenase-like enzyme
MNTLLSAQPATVSSARPAARTRPEALLLGRRDKLDLIYGPAEREALTARVRLLDPALLDSTANTHAHAAALARVEVIFTGWGCPVFDEALLDRLPALRAVFYGAGSVRSLVTPAFWARDITLVNAVAANAVPVAEFTLAALIFSLKHAFAHAAAQRAGADWWSAAPGPGAYRSTVGLVSVGTIGRLVIEHLRLLDVEVLAYDPFLSDAEARALRVTRVATLEELFARADAVSVHTPLLPETTRLIRGHHLAALRPGAAFINTARGGVVHEPELIATLRARPDLQAVLDVTETEPPSADSPLRSLPNVFLTPHIAGSAGHECRRMGALMLAEFDRWHSGQPLHHALTAERAALMG